MNKKKLTFLTLITSFLLPQLVAAQSSGTVFDRINELLNSFARTVLGDQQTQAIINMADTLWIPVFGVFFLVFTLFFAAALRIPLFKNERRWAGVIGVVFGLVAVGTPGTVSTIWSLGGLAVFIIALLILGFLVYSIWQSGRTGVAEAGKELKRAQRKEKKEKKKLHDATKEEKRAKQDLDVVKKNIGRENKAIKDAQKAAKTEFDLENELEDKLNHVMKMLRQLEKIPIESQEAQKMKDSLLKELSTAINTAESTEKIEKKIKKAIEEVENLDVKEIKEGEEVDQIAERMTQQLQNAGVQDIDNQAINRYARHMRGLAEEKRRVIENLNKLNQDVEDDDSNLVHLMTLLAQSLRNHNIPKANQLVAQAMKFVQQEKNFIKRMNQELDNLRDANKREAADEHELEQQIQRIEQHLRA